jgi:hypothetical protein
MTVATRSAFPPPVEDLMPAARDLATNLGSVPSRNRLMGELKIGAPKANAIRDQLLTETAGPGQTEEPDPEPAESDAEGPERSAAEPSPEVDQPADPGTATPPAPARTLRPWPLLLLAAPAFIAIWSGWVGLGELTGFGPVRLLPGIADRFEINTAITLPVGMETYAAYALRVWLTPTLPARARRFAQWSAIGSLLLGAAGQVAYHLMVAARIDHAPWQITTLVACVPVGVVGMGAALAHLLIHQPREEP